MYSGLVSTTSAIKRPAATSSVNRLSNDFESLRQTLALTKGYFFSNSLDTGPSTQVLDV